MNDQLQEAHQAQEDSPNPKTSKVCHVCTVGSWGSPAAHEHKTDLTQRITKSPSNPLQSHVSIQLPCQLDDSSLISCDAAPATPDVEQGHSDLQTSPSEQNGVQVEASGQSATSSAASGSGFSRGQHFNPEHDAILRVECLSARRLKVGTQAALPGCCWGCQQQAAPPALSHYLVWCHSARAAICRHTATLVLASL